MDDTVESIRPDDSEVAVMMQIYADLQGFSQPAQNRMLRYIAERLVEGYQTQYQDKFAAEVAAQQRAMQNGNPQIQGAIPFPGPPRPIGA